MGFTRALRTAGGTVLAAALVLSSATQASADDVRDKQWPLEAFDSEGIWKISQGAGVTVAVIDEGVDAQHPDVKGSVIEGKDFIDGGATTPKAGESHGTGMASLIAGHGHGAGDSDGVMGLAPKARILSIRDDGTGGGDPGAPIRYAVDHGASVINISLAGPQRSADEAAAVAYALQHDVLVVAGSGNDGKGPDAPMYPASYPGVLAVGGVDNRGVVWSGSNYGPDVLVTAPATRIISSGGNSNAAGYGIGDGTSNATAFVSAAAALLRAKFPDLTAGQIANRLTKTAGLPAAAKGTDLPDDHYGYGFIQPLAALKQEIPAGSKYGPLSVPESLKEGAPGANAPKDNSTASDDAASSSSSDNSLVLAVVGLAGLIVVVLVILLIVKIARRGKRNNGGPGGPGGPGWGGNGQPQYGQPPHQPQYQQGGGNPYQQQSQAPGRWPNQ
ncbi:S8 family serine peptidase [Actinacidiphila glaucinigra]|uniref:S8 family serine peptidase n=1 Tax=Actinacidiphila glaucinigra TaxID=235986 RepID=UPI0033CA1D43